MRKRDEIIADLPLTFGSDHQCDRDRVLLEVLLDIRSLLLAQQKQVQSK